MISNNLRETHFLRIIVGCLIIFILFSISSFICEASNESILFQDQLVEITENITLNKHDEMTFNNCSVIFNASKGESIMIKVEEDAILSINNTSFNSGSSNVTYFFFIEGTVHINSSKFNNLDSNKLKYLNWENESLSFGFYFNNVNKSSINNVSITYSSKSCIVLNNSTFFFNNVSIKGNQNGIIIHNSTMKLSGISIEQQGYLIDGINLFNSIVEIKNSNLSCTFYNASSGNQGIKSKRSIGNISNSSIINYRYGFDLDDYSSLNIDNCEIINSMFGIFLTDSPCNITNSSFINVTRGIQIYGTFPNLSSNIFSKTIDPLFFYFYVYFHTAVYLEDNLTHQISSGDMINITQSDGNFITYKRIIGNDNITRVQIHSTDVQYLIEDPLSTLIQITGIYKHNSTTVNMSLRDVINQSPIQILINYYPIKLSDLKTNITEVSRRIAKEGDQVLISFIIENVGDEYANQIEIILLYGNVIIYQSIIPSIGPGRIQQHYYQWKSNISGSYHVVVRIDPKNRIEEYSEYNNEDWIEIRVHPRNSENDIEEYSLFLGSIIICLFIFIAIDKKK